MAQAIKRNLPRDVFLHLLATITLYWSAVSFITLLWQFINRFLPDPRYLNYDSELYYSGPMRFAIASLIIVFPVYVLVSWFLSKLYKKDPQSKEMRLRKWLIYFTLFVAALIIIGDLVAVIVTYLQGDITSRFILKALSVLVVAVVIFAYYLDDVRRQKPSKSVKYFIWAVCAVVLLSVVGAFFIVGSPREVRLRQFDQQRINDLQNIQYQIVNYWQRKEKLPNALSELNDPISGFLIPVDPETKTAYEYVVKDVTNLSFELCAVFNREGKTPNYGYSMPVPVPAARDLYSQNWNHTAGRVCFERTIDKELYPPLDKIKD